MSLAGVPNLNTPEVKENIPSIPKPSAPDPPSLKHSEAYDTLKLFDHLGLGGDDVGNIFDINPSYISYPFTIFTKIICI